MTVQTVLLPYDLYKKKKATVRNIMAKVKNDQMICPILLIVYKLVTIVQPKCCFNVKSASSN